MSLKQYLMEGAAAGTTATGGNGTTPGGTTGALILNKAGGTQTHTAAAAAHGSCGLEIVTTASGQYNIARFLANAANDKMAVSGVFSVLGGGAGSAINSRTPIGGIRQSASDVLPVKFYVDNVAGVNKFSVLDSNDASLSASNLQYTFTPGTQYRLEVLMNRATSTATANLYTPTGTTPLATWSSSTATFPTGTPNGVELGCISSSGAMTIRWDDIQLNDGATTEIGAYSPSATDFTFALALDKTSGQVPYTQTATASPTGTTPATATGRQYTFDFGNGDTAGPQSSASASHSVTTAGSYTATVTVNQPA